MTTLATMRWVLTQTTCSQAFDLCTKTDLWTLEARDMLGRHTDVYRIEDYTALSSFSIARTNCPHKRLRYWIHYAPHRTGVIDPTFQR